MKEIIRMNQLAGLITEGQAKKMMAVLNETDKGVLFEQKDPEKDKEEIIKKINNLIKKKNYDRDDAIEIVLFDGGYFVNDGKEFKKFLNSINSEILTDYWKSEVGFNNAKKDKEKIIKKINNLIKRGESREEAIAKTLEDGNTPYFPDNDDEYNNFLKSIESDIIG